MPRLKFLVNEATIRGLPAQRPPFHLGGDARARAMPGRVSGARLGAAVRGAAAPFASLGKR
ncbi:hypothetical protein GCM10008026_34500 [Chelatococcus composti]|nr:MAG: hypothetical protein DIU59_07460 [Pseudomonadota bacterium]GGG50365.1 hypothetical protein GCM10008026_34500 [Chelatococcus composti]